MFNKFFFFLEKLAVYEIMWKHGKSGQAIDNNKVHVHSCWIPKATNTYLEYVIFISCPLWQWLFESASKLRFIYNACLVKFSDEEDSNRGPLKYYTLTLVVYHEPNFITSEVSK